MADVPKDLLQEIERLEKLFTVDATMLKKVTDHFITELDKGLSVEGGSIVSHHSKSCISLVELS